MKTMNKQTPLILVLLLIASILPIINVQADPQQSNLTSLTDVVITMKAEGGPCGCVPVNAEDLSCCPAYSISIYGDGTVTYDGVASVKIRGKRVYKIPVEHVTELVDEFDRVGFYTLEDRYEGGISHANATTISISVNGKTKSIYVFHGEPEALRGLMRKVYEVSKAVEYTGRASEMM
jgi:hypothetical protein